MQRYGFIYEKIYTRENIQNAIYKASKKKRKHRAVKRILANEEDAINEIQYMLITQTYKPSPYRHKVIKEGVNQKRREISIPQFFPDQIIQWAIILQISPAILRGMDPFCCGSIPHRGNSYAKRHLEHWLRKEPKETKYCLKLDVHHFYPSIGHGRLKAMLRKLFKDEKLLRLLDLIIDSAPGLPIGNVTSQWLANFYLQGLDHCIREKLKIKRYVRSMDDMVILGANKRKLGRARLEIESYLKRIGLTLNPHWQKFKVDSRGIDFLGYRFFHDKTILRRALMLKISRKVLRTAKKKTWNPGNCKSIMSYRGWFKRSNNYGMYQRRIKPYIKIKKLKEVIRNESVQHGNAGKGVPDPSRRR